MHSLWHYCMSANTISCVIEVTFLRSVYISMYRVLFSGKLPSVAYMPQLRTYWPWNMQTPTGKTHISLWGLPVTEHVNKFARWNSFIFFMLLKGYTSLQIAVMYDHTDVISYLMENGADPKIFNKVHSVGYSSCMHRRTIIIIIVLYIL